MTAYAKTIQTKEVQLVYLFKFFITTLIKNWVYSDWLLTIILLYYLALCSIVQYYKVEIDLCFSIL